MNLPNLFTLLRIIFVPIIVIFLIQESYWSAFVFFVLSGITDGLDGFFARILNQRTIIGAYLDPIADKALVMSCFITLSVKHLIPGWLSVIVVSRDCIILVGICLLALMSVPLEIKPSYISKVTTLVQLATILWVLLELSTGHGVVQKDVAHILYGVTALLTTISGLDYIRKGIKLVNSKE
ncbi:MAG: CDP-alcohol phosphatidyltransferase family protein [Syntrophales bacterium]|nr:CDP-alcohol phosphatidyltransferase family protein [Syntrophales bacterium]